MKKYFIVICLFLITNILYPAFIVQAQTVQTAQIPLAQATQTTQIAPPELPPTPRSKLEIIQYILLPFAIGASIWLILRLEKMEQEEKKEDKQE